MVTFLQQIVSITKALLDDLQIHLIEDCIFMLPEEAVPQCYTSDCIPRLSHSIYDKSRDNFNATHGFANWPISVIKINLANVSTESVPAPVGISSKWLQISWYQDY